MGYSLKKLVNGCKAALVVLIFSNQVTAQNQAANTSPSDPIDFEQKANDLLENKVTGFTENKGQVADKDGKLVPQVLFKADAKGGEVYITTSGITYVFSKIDDIDNPIISSIALKMDLVGATIKNENIITKSALPGKNNYFLPHIPNGAMNAYTYQHITVKNIYPGIDWILYTTENSKGIKYDFVVHPGANPANIKMQYIGAGEPVLKDERTLTIETPFGNIKEGNLFTYNGSYAGSLNKKEIASSYQLNDNNEVSFNIANYNKQEDLVIDPPLVWATYYGGSEEEHGYSIATPPSGNVYVTGYNYNAGTPFPRLDPGGTTYFQNNSAMTDVFIIKFDAAGIRKWATNYASSWYDAAYDIATDDNENIFIVGEVQKSSSPGDFPVDSSLAAGSYYQAGFDPAHLGSGAFILKFDSIGTRKWATLYTGINWDHATGVAVNGENVYVVGTTESIDLPVLDEGGGSYFQGTHGGGTRDAFILKFDTVGVRKMATYYGGSGNDLIGNIPARLNPKNSQMGNGNVTIGPSGGIYVVGSTSSTNLPSTGGGFQATNGGSNDVFMLKLNPSSDAIQWATYYGGSGSDMGYSLSVKDANIYVTGSTASSNFPLQSLAGAYNQATLGNGGGGSMDAFILKFNTSGTRSWSTYFGGNGNDEGYSLINDDCGNLFVTGYTTSSSNFSTLDPADGSYFQAANAGSLDAFILQFDNQGAQVWATYYGGSGTDDRGRSINVSSTGGIFVTGETRSTNLSTVDMGGSSWFQGSLTGGSWHDLFVLKFSGSSGSINVTTPNLGICPGGVDSVALKVTGGTIPYTWNTTAGNPADTLDSLVVNTPGIYWVSDSTACGFSTDTIEILENPTLTLNIESPDTILCPAPAIDSAMLVVSGGITYLWSTGETTDTIYVNSIDVYSVMSDTISCAGKLADTINVIEDPGVIVDFGLADSLCAGVVFVLDAGNPGETYLWSTGETSQTINLVSTGTFWGTATNTNGCSASDTFNLIAKPTVSILLEPLCGSIMINTSVSLGSAAVNYLWSPGGETTADIEVSTSAVYQINVFDGFCADSASVDITASALEDLTPIILPNVFTPNGDGINDEFGVGSDDPFDEFSLKVYNRWGTLLFEGNEVSQKWDGTDNNGDINEGVYFWIIHYKPTCFPDLEDTATGTVSVLR